MATEDAGSQRHTGLSSPVETTAWAGWVLFGALMLILLGAFHAIAGVVALFRESYYLVGPNDLLVSIDYTGWGWTHLVVGLLAIVAGFGLMVGRLWARIAAIVIACISALVNLAFIAAHPVWSAIVIALAVITIYAIAVHGSETKQFAGDR